MDAYSSKDSLVNVVQGYNNQNLMMQNMPDVILEVKSEGSFKDGNVGGNSHRVNNLFKKDSHFKKVIAQDQPRNMSMCAPRVNYIPSVFKGVELPSYV